MAQPVGARHRVVVIGSGFGGLFATKHLGRSELHVTVISRTTHHLFQPLLYQVATGILSEGEIAPATRDILRLRRNVEVLLGDVQAVDLQARTVTSTALGTTTVTGYDSLIVAAGASTSYFGNDEFALDAPGLKSVDDALELRGRIFGAFELAELASNEAERTEWMTFVVVGAGPTGVELAGQISELSRRTLPRDFRRIDTRKTRIVLVDALSTVLGSFGTKVSAHAAGQLHRLGVEVWLNAKVTDVDDHGLVITDDHGHQSRIEARTVVWAAGVHASPLAKNIADQAGVNVDRSGRIPVEPDVTVAGHPEVFVIGDMMSLNHYPGVAQVAMQQGKYAAETVLRRLRGSPPQPPFRYFDKGSMATISRFSAVASIGRWRFGGRRFGGFVAWLMWLVVHVMYLVGFKNRLTTVLHWAISFLGRDRSERTVTHQQLVARAALHHLDIPHLGVPPARAAAGTVPGDAPGRSDGTPAAAAGASGS